MQQECEKKGEARKRKAEEANQRKNDIDVVTLLKTQYMYCKKSFKHQSII